MSEKDIKSEIRKLRKLKRQCRAGTEERLNLHRQIKLLQEKLVERIEIDKEKEPLIKQILVEDELLRKLGIDLNKFTIEELQHHLSKIKK